MEDNEYKNGSTVNEEKELNQLVDLVELSLDMLEEDQDAFIEYTHQLRKRFHQKNPAAFRAKLIKGYQKLLHEVIKIP